MEPAAPSKLKLSKMGYVILFVRDVMESVPFYRDVLGVPFRHAEPGWGEFDLGGTTLALHSYDKPMPRLPETTPNVVFSVEDVRAAHGALLASGVKAGDLHVVCEVDGKVGLSTNFTDPDGNPLSVYGMVPKGEWKG